GLSGFVRVWDTATGAPLTDLIRYENKVNSVVFDSDGKLILTTSADGLALLRDAASCKIVAEPLRHRGNVNSAFFSSEGGRIVTASGDKTVQIWDTATGARISEPFRHQSWVSFANFSPGGGQILTVSGDNSVRLWDATTGELRAENRERLERLLEIAGGKRLNDRQLLETVPKGESAVLRVEFDETTDLDCLLLWWWSDPFTRPIHPSSAITVPDFVRRRIGEVLDWPDETVRTSALHEARDPFPHHPLVSLCEALAEPAIAPDPVWLRQYAVSRLLAEPHYLVPLEPLHPYGDAKANRQYELTHGLAVDCLLGARLLLNDRPGEARSTDPERIAQARQLLARARKLSPENLDIRKLANELGVAD
ncbi:MAG: hypothetical protein KDL87_13270, partial [Verrucomicrobiae bacterium]|nr:hypothetical protein [Verrucomicrobiae bacterium]